MPLKHGRWTVYHNQWETCSQRQEVKFHHCYIWEPVPRFTFPRVKIAVFHKLVLCLLANFLWAIGFEQTASVTRTHTGLPAANFQNKATAGAAVEQEISFDKASNSLTVSLTGCHTSCAWLLCSMAHLACGIWKMTREILMWPLCAWTSWSWWIVTIYLRLHSASFLLYEEPSLKKHWKCITSQFFASQTTVTGNRKWKKEKGSGCGCVKNMKKNGRKELGV